jgi:predicted dehydrogenase
MKTMKMGVIGAGNIGFFHIRGLKMVNVYGDYDVDLVTLCDTNKEQAEKIGKRFGFKKITTDYHDVINDPEIDVVSVLTPNYTHAEIAIAAAKAGKNVMVEKPMTMDMAEAKEMKKVFDEAGVTSMVNFIYRTVPVINEAKKMFDSGKLGDITFFKGWFECSYKADPEKELQWRDEKKKAATGVIGDIVAHVVSLSDFVGGSKLGKITEVCAVTDTYYKQRKDMENNGAIVDIDTDDVCAVIVKYESGRSGIMYASRIAHGHDNWLGYEIEGTEGTVSFDLNRLNELRIWEKSDYETQGFKTVLGNPSHIGYRDFNIYEESGVSYPELFAMHYHKLFKAIENHEKVDIDVSYGADVDKVLFAIVKSVEENRWVKISEME